MMTGIRGCGSQVDDPFAAVGQGGGVGRLHSALDAVQVLLVHADQHTDHVRQLHLQVTQMA